MTKEEYHDALNIAAGRAVGWEAVRNLVWCWQEVWDPTHNDRHIGMLLAKVLDSDTVYRVTIQNRHAIIADPAWLATICGKGNRVAREPGDSSWRVALVKACIVICGGTLPEDVVAA